MASSSLSGPFTAPSDHSAWIQSPDPFTVGQMVARVKPPAHTRAPSLEAVGRPRLKLRLRPRPWSESEFGRGPLPIGI